MMGDIRLGKQIEMELIEPLVGRIVDSIFTQQDALMPLARLKQHDNYTFQHSVSVCALMTAFARNAARCRTRHPRDRRRRPAARRGQGQRAGRDPEQAGQAHRRRVREDEEPRRAEQDHPAGHTRHQRRSRSTSPPSTTSASTAPATRTSSRGSRSACMARWARSSMSTTRSRPTASITRACHRPRRCASCWTGASSTSSRELVKAFIRAVGIYPAGALVRLESKRLAVVQAQNDDKPMQPTVKVIFHTDGYAPAPLTPAMKTSTCATRRTASSAMRTSPTWKQLNPARLVTEVGPARSTRRCAGAPPGAKGGSAPAQSAGIASSASCSSSQRSSASSMRSASSA
jgi:hypothetical protein